MGVQNMKGVTEGRIQTEFINTSSSDVKVEAGTVLGYVEFTDDESLNATAEETEMVCSYKGYDSGYESEEGSDDEDEEKEMEDIQMDESPGDLTKTGGGSNDQEKPMLEQLRTRCQPGPEPAGCTKKHQIPPGAKKLSIDYSEMAKDALPFRKELQNLLEVKHTGAFAKHDRDYGKTNLIQFRANLKEKVISYGRKKLSRPQQKWSTYDREFFALLCGVRANAHYLHHIAFLAITDHCCHGEKLIRERIPQVAKLDWQLSLTPTSSSLSTRK
jgi:hypothetical protein